MPMKLLSADEFRHAAKTGAHPEGTVFRFATADPEMQNEDTRTMRFVFSDATVDHAGDSINPQGWDLSIFNRNPVALFAHNSWDPPIGRASNVGVVGNKLMGDIEFAPPEVYEFADTIYRLVRGGYLKAVSVGFMPKKWSFSNEPTRSLGIDFEEQSLLEISVCPVPCNPNALGEARSAGLDTRPLTAWAEKVLDTGETIILPRKDVEALRRQASNAPLVKYHLQMTGSVSPAKVEAARAELLRVKNDRDAVPVLPQGLELRATTIIGQTEGAPVIPTVDKVGRKISAATRAMLDKAMEHHDAMGQCIRDVLDAADKEDDAVEEGLDPSDDDGPDMEPDGDADDPAGPQTIPPGTVLPEPATPEARLAEARALKAALNL